MEIFCLSQNVFGSHFAQISETIVAYTMDSRPLRFLLTSNPLSLRGQGQSIRAIARHFNVGVATIDRIERSTQPTE